MKTCRGCSEKKDFSLFAKSSRDADGYQRYCKDCKKALYYASHEKNRLKQKDYYKNHRDDCLVKMSEYQKANRTAANERNRKWASTNKATKAANLARYRSAKDNRTPKWLTEEHYNQIKEKYWLAEDLRKVTGETYHVDHIVPLRGENVSGLHVPWNLQILPMDLNCSKSNMMEQMQIAVENGL